MPYYRPRMMARLSVPVWGAPSDRVKQEDTSSLVEFDVVPTKASWLRNDHNHADELSITLDWRDAGVDPRLLSSGIVAFYLGSADEYGQWNPKKDRRFLGIITDVERSSDSNGRSVQLKALDFTTLLIEAKPFPPEGVPNCSMALDEAWRHICSHAGGKDTKGNWFRSVDLLTNKLTPQGVAKWPPSLSSAVGKRFANKAPVPVRKGTDAWAVWQHCVGMLGLISWIDQDQVIVTTSTALYSRQDPPVLVWGQNIASMRERRNCAIAGKKICLMSYDPILGRVLQSRYPAPGVKSRKKGRSGGTADKSDDYEVFELNGITVQKALDDAAKRVYEERSRQELEGTVTTSEMWIETINEKAFDILTLRAGQDIRIELEQQTLDGLRKLTNIAERQAWLEDRGYSPSVAELLAKNEQALAGLSPVFYTKSISISFECDEHGGAFSTEITYCNRIEITGDAES